MIIFSDFDKTIFYPNDENKTAKNLAAIKNWLDAGHDFAICTGRSCQSLLRMPVILDLLPRFKYLILDRGSIIADSAGKTKHCFSFTPTELAEIENFIDGFPNRPIAQYYTTKEETLIKPTDPITKIRFYYRDEPTVLAVYEKASQTFPKTDRALHANNIVHPELAGIPCFVEFSPATSGKASAITWASQKDGIKKSEIITIGDGRNDVDMLEAFDGYTPAGSFLAKNDYPSKKVDSLADLILSAI